MNDQNRNQVILAAVLGVVLVGVLIYQFVIKGGPAPPPQPSGSGAQQQQASAAEPAGPAEGPARLRRTDVNLDKLLKNIEIVTFVYNNERISRNPMTPLVGRVFQGQIEQEPTTPGTAIWGIRNKNVSGIIYNEFNPVAIVDDEVITEGHQYADGVVVTNIEPKRVWFKWQESLIPVELQEL